MSLKSFCYSAILLFLSLFCRLNSINAQQVSQDNYDVVFYWLDLNVSDTSTFISGNTKIDIRIANNSDEVFFNMGSGLQVNSVTVNDEPVAYNHRSDSLFILHNYFKQDSIYRITIDYAGDGNDDNNDGAVFNSNTDYGKVTFTLTEPFGTKYWFPCKEVLTDKADSVYVFITTPKGLKAGSNGVLDKVVEIDDSHTQHQWKSKYPVAFYLISFSVADYMDYTIYANLNDSISALPVVNYIYNATDYLNKNKNDIDITVELLKVFSEKLGIYPFNAEKYGHCTAPIGGGMEHQTMTTLTNFKFGLVAHELAHQWYGNYVTCSDWNSIWINEGFATYGEYIAIEALKTPDEAQSWLINTHGLALSTDRGSVYIPEPETEYSDRIFDYYLSYNKGASIIHMIRYELQNDSLFFAILREFLARNAFKNGDGEDFKNVLEELSGRSFDVFFDEWYYGEGYPIIEMYWYQRNDSLYIVNNQMTSAPDVTDFFHLKLEYKLYFPTGDSIIRFDMDQPSQTFKIYMPRPVYDIQINPNNHVLMKQYAEQAADSGNVTINPVLFFPNPTTALVNLFSRSVSDAVNLDIYNISGRKIQSLSNIHMAYDQVSLSGYSPGIYIFHVFSPSLNSTVKIIKQ